MYRTQGIIIRKTDFREADRIYTIYSQDFGKIKILAKGIRKINAKLRAPLELFNYIDFYFVQGKTLRIITGAELINKFSALKGDFRKLEIGHDVLGLLDEAVKGEEKDLRIWNLIIETMMNLDGAKSEDRNIHSLILYYLKLKLLEFLGFSPQLYQCVFCGVKIVPEKIFFSIKEGGLVCENCIRGETDSVEVTPSLIKILRVILEKDWAYVRKLKLTKTEEDYLQKVIQYFWKYMVE